MDGKFEKYKEYLVYGALVLVLILAFIYRSITRKPGETTSLPNVSPSPLFGSPVPSKSPTPTKSPEPSYSAEYLDSQQRELDRNKELDARSSKVGELLKVVPYHGINFSIAHDYSTGQYVVNLKPGKEAEGNAELDKFLQLNGINSRSWISLRIE